MFGEKYKYGTKQFNKYGTKQFNKYDSYSQHELIYPD